MTKTTAIAGLLAMFFVASAPAQDSERITALEKEVQELKMRLSRLEASPDASEKKPPPAAPSGDVASLSNWKKLKTDMTTSQVRTLLGEPIRIDGGAFVSWHYRNGGQVRFVTGRVERWTEPRK
jgi:outer membrane protein assembly factor BamE (lipoprotein component of BamABCDE complex)